jgi:signal transduction histidine kinase
MVPIVSIWWLAFYTSNASQRSLKDAIRQTAVARAVGIMDEIDRSINDRIADWVSFNQDSPVQAALIESNANFGTMTDIEAYVDEEDRLWRAAPQDSPTSLSKEIFDAKLSSGLRAKIDRLTEANGYPVFPEVFVTNLHGVNIAQTNRTSDYRQNDEEWWIQALQQGFHVSDVHFDESAGVHSTDICLRIDDSHGHALGVMKAVFNIRNAIDIIDSRSDKTENGYEQDVILFTSTRQIVHASGRVESLGGDGSHYFTGIDLPANKDIALAERIDSNTRESYLSTYVRSKGYGKFSGLGWTLLFEHRLQEVFRPVVRLRRKIFLFAALATLLILAINGLVSFSFSYRLRRLAAATTTLGEGDLDASVSEKGSDEIAVVCRSFNSMARQLKRATRCMTEQTHALEEKNHRLNQEIADRVAAENQRNTMEIHLRHAQKMESIGQLSAGIAHEINTPTQFIGDNIRFLKDSFNDLQGVLDVYGRLMQAAKSIDSHPEAVAEAEEKAGKADLAYLREEIPKAITQSLDGVERVARIVGSLKDFSHPASDTKTPTDLNRAIASTVNVSTNEWKYVATIQTEFDPTLPPVPCFPGDINQVFLNMIVNSAHAIADVVKSTPREKGTITITTGHDNDWAEITISDTGTGIPPEALSRIFDPFFTTKAVGKGTGQGLAISHAIIVERHKGSIDVQSQVGTGTTFVIRLPLTNLPANEGVQDEKTRSICR